MGDAKNPKSWRGIWRHVIAVIVGLIALAGASLPARAVSNFCPWGTCDIATPVYVNVYWAASASAWDAAQSSSTATITRIDALTNALFHTAYFSALSQYSVSSASLQPSIVASGCAPAPAVIDDAFNQVKDLANCVLAAHPNLDPDVTILNVFLPPSTAPASPTADFCKKFNGEHDKYGSPVAITIIPTHPACNGSVTGVFSTLTHEMTEATTDPNPSSPTGWKTCCNPVDEVADQCEGVPNRFVNFMFAQVSTYFSDSANTCVPGFALTAPKIVTANACGSGSKMKITLTGSFGPPPWDLTTVPASYPNPASSHTLFLNAKIGDASNPTNFKWSVGDIAGFPVDTVGFGKITWTFNGGTNDTIVIDGFDGHYGATAPNGAASVVSPGETITFTLTRADTGQKTTTKLVVPGPTTVSGLQAVPTYFWLSPAWIEYGELIQIQGTLTGNGGCPVEGEAVTISSNDPSPLVVQSATRSDGSFSADYHFAGPAGKHTIKTTAPVASSATVVIHPKAAFLSAEMGAVAGHQTLTINATGFASGGDGGYAPGVPTTVVFRSGPYHANATAVSVPDTNTVTFSSPPSPLPGNGTGTVDVVAIINGAESPALSYTYVVPDQPVLTMIGPSCPWSPTWLQVDAYKADGSNAAEQVNLSANYAAFVTGNTTVASTTITSGNSIQLKGPGPITVTAAPAGQPTLATKLTATFQPAANPCVPQPFVAYQFQLGVGPGPVESVVLNPLYGQNGQSVVWTAPAKTAQSLSYVMLTGVDRATASAASTLEVSAVGQRALANAVREQANVYLNEAREGGHARFLGQGFVLRSVAPAGAAATHAAAAPAPGAAAAVLPAPDTLLRAQAIVSFELPVGADTEPFRIVHRTPGADAWTEVKSFVDRNNRSVALRANVSARGIYALVQLEK
jgi:hypothetical protein